MEGTKRIESNLDSMQTDASAKLVLDHGDLVGRIVSRLATTLPSSVELNDLHQAGFVGLIEASRSFKPDRGIAFDKFASSRVRGAVMDELRARSWMPRSLSRQLRGISAATHRVEQEEGRAVTSRELADSMKVTIADINGALADAARSAVLSIDAHSEPAIGILLKFAETSTSPAETHCASEFSGAMAVAVKSLEKTERLVFLMRFYKDSTLREIGEVLHLTESRVCQIEQKAIARLARTLADWTIQTPDASGPSRKNTAKRHAGKRAVAHSTGSDPSRNAKMHVKTPPAKLRYRLQELRSVGSRRASQAPGQMSA